MQMIRPMIYEDAPAVAQIHVKAWQNTYQGILPDHYLKAMSVQKETETLRLGMELNSDIIRLVVEEQAQILGFAAGMENLNPQLIPDYSAELWALYVDPKFQRQGVGQKLLRAFGHTQNHEFLVWVLEKNLTARQFYTSAGGVLLNQTKTLLFGATIHKSLVFSFQKKNE